MRKDTCGEGTKGKVRKQRGKLPREVSVHGKPENHDDA